MSASAKKSKPVGLPPSLGKAGSVAFFATLFSLADKNPDGYAMFRKCHSNCVNGILHFVGMPLAVSGVFLIIRSVSDSADFTRYLSFCVTTGYLYLYLQFETNPITPWLFYILYMSIWEFILYRRVLKDPTFNRLAYLITGILLIAVNVGALEAVGHGVFEHHHSYVEEFFNSVFHTPLYGMNSVVGTFFPSPDHVCW
eukprot:Nitzschia sp. Nitz4//scaffold20_size174350//48846//49506//NITZ4_002088-RA/size174350-snap-gene-0.238-mRNA-1//-1//CDS//3329541767//699//frame0